MPVTAGHELKVACNAAESFDGCDSCVLVFKATTAGSEQKHATLILFVSRNMLTVHVN